MVKKIWGKIPRYLYVNLGDENLVRFGGDLLQRISRPALRIATIPIALGTFHWWAASLLSTAGTPAAMAEGPQPRHNPIQQRVII